MHTYTQAQSFRMTVVPHLCQSMVVHVPQAHTHTLSSTYELIYIVFLFWGRSRCLLSESHIHTGVTEQNTTGDTHALVSGGEHMYICMCVYILGGYTHMHLPRMYPHNICYTHT
jgi:hypothetical protein